MNYDDFRDAIGLKESSNNYLCTNQFGYLGRYQFGMARLTDFGLASRIPGTRGYANSDFQWVTPFSKEGFLNSSQLQDAVFDNHVVNLIGSINKDCGPKIGTEVQGVLVTMSGALACCHLLGIGGLVDFLNRGIIDKDGDGTTSVDYIQMFNGYDLGLVNPWSLAQLAFLLAAHSPTTA
jgi:hypothetical protein